MEQILPALEGQLRRFRDRAAWLAAHHPRLASQLGGPHGAPDAHADRLAQGVACLHARSALALQRARCQQDEHLLERHYPEQLRPFPECRIGPGRGGHGAAKLVSARYLPGPDAAIELGFALGPSAAATLDFYIDGDAGFSAALRSALLAGGGSGGPPQVRPEGASWRELSRWPIGPGGMDPAEALLPRAPGGHAGLALLREFFIFPARFNVLRLDLSVFGGPGYWTLRLPVAAAQLLEPLRASHLRAGWTASAGLQRVAAAPVMLDGLQCEYLVSVPPALEIFSIDSVRVAGAECLDWVARRVDGAPPGHEWRIAFPTADSAGSAAVASIDATCCRRAGLLARPARGPGCRWQLNSLLALEQLPRNAGTLRELMAAQAIGLSPSAQAIIGAVQCLSTQPALLRSGRSAPLQGTELRLLVDESALAGCGLLLFAQVMDRLFGECVHMNSFTRLVLGSARTGKELIRCQARNAGTVLE